MVSISISVGDRGIPDWCRRIESTIEGRMGLEVVSGGTFELDFGTTKTFQRDVGIVMPQADTGAIMIRFRCASAERQFGDQQLIATDSLEYRMLLPTPRNATDQSAPVDGEYTEADLAKLCNIEFCLHGDDQRAIAEGILGNLPDSARIGKGDCYRLLMKLGTALRLHQEGIELDSVRANHDSSTGFAPLPGESRHLSIGNSVVATDGAVGLAWIEPSVDLGYLPANSPITFYIYLRNDFGINMEGMISSEQRQNDHPAEIDRVDPDSVHGTKSEITPPGLSLDSVSGVQLPHLI